MLQTFFIFYLGFLFFGYTPQNNRGNKTCSFVTEGIALPNPKLEENNDMALSMKIWYSDIYRTYKIWKKETKPENKKIYADRIIEYSWNILRADPKSKEIRKLKKRGTVKQNILVAERLSDVYIDMKNIDMLGGLLSRFKKGFDGSSKLNKYAIVYFNKKGNRECEALQYEYWISNIPKVEENKEKLFKIYAGMLNVLEILGEKEKAIKKCDEYLSAYPEEMRMEEKKMTFYGSNEEVYNALLKQLEKNGNDKKTLENAGNLSLSMENYADAYKWYKKLSNEYPDEVEYRRFMVEASFRLNKFSEAVKNGKGLNDLESKEYIVRSYIGLEKFGDAYKVASSVQKENNEKGHYLKGLIYESAANSAQDDAKFRKKEYEWRLLYRLSNIEYLYGGSLGKERARSINKLIPTKGSLFLKKGRTKPKAGKYSNWIVWKKIYDKKIYGPDI